MSVVYRKEKNDQQTDSSKFQHCPKTGTTKTAFPKQWKVRSNDNFFLSLERTEDSSGENESQGCLYQ